MLKQIAALVMALMFSAVCCKQEFARYRSVEAYEVRPGVLLIPRYTPDGEICELGLERLHNSSAAIRLDPGLSRTEISQVFDELVPATERGPRSNDAAGALITQGGGSLTTTIGYKNVTVQIYGATESGCRKNETVADEVAATIRFKDRTCK